MIHRLALLTLLTTSLSPALPQTSPVLTTPVSTSAPSPAALAAERELTQRALGFDDGDLNVQATLLVSQLPKALLGPLPIVPSARLIGSLVRTSGTPRYPGTQQIYYDSAGSAEAVQSALQESLKTLGWTAFAGQLGPELGGGFQAQVSPARLAYYRLEQQVSLSAVLRQAGSVTRVTLNLSSSPNLRQQIQFRERGQSWQQSPLPTLRPPSGTTVSPGSSGSSGSSWNTSATLKSSLTVVQLLDDYSAQLKAAGWALLIRNDKGKVVTSVWQFQDLDKQTQTGVLTLRDDGQTQFSAQLVSLVFAP